MATLHEYYNTGDNVDWYNIGNASQWPGQSFTPQTQFTITSVKLKLLKSGSPGIFTVHITATDGSGLPTGSDLASGTYDGDTLTGSAAWYEITLGAGATLTSGTKYALYISCPTASAGNVIIWRGDNSSPTYTRGSALSSENSGSSWANYSNIDTMFETWGQFNFTPPATGPDTTMVKRLVAVADNKVFYESV